MSTQNGWPILKGSQTYSWHIPHTVWEAPLENGTVGLLLSVHAVWFNHAVEHVDNGARDDWGWAPVRPVTDAAPDDISNHCSGTAIDLNATRHPRGRHNTFSTEDTLLIHRRLYFYSHLAGLYASRHMPRGWDSNNHASILRWGGDYNNTVDPMHWEANLPPHHPAWHTIVHQLLIRPRGKLVLSHNRKADIHV